MYDILELNEKLVAELREIAKGLNIENYEGLKKQDLVYKILDHQAIHPELVKTKKKQDKNVLRATRRLADIWGQRWASDWEPWWGRSRGLDMQWVCCRA